ncbi:HET-domain-containing protein [Cadophora sp. DSE1049]|nr:HET-domain-containing protein [Cadophora sp. DSE1049]
MSGYSQGHRADVLNNEIWTRKAQDLCRIIRFDVSRSCASHVEKQLIAYYMDRHWIFDEDDCSSASMESSQHTSLRDVLPSPPPAIITVNKMRMCSDCSAFYDQFYADPKIVQEYAKKRFYFHHCCIACVNKASLEEGCQLCSFFLTCFVGRINISRDDKLGAALELPGTGVWVVLTQGADTLATTTDGRRFAAMTQASNWTGSFTFHYDKIAAQIDLTSMLAGFDDEILVNCPPSVPRDTPLEDDKAWLENSMKMAKAWYKNCLDRVWLPRSTRVGINEDGKTACPCHRCWSQTEPFCRITPPLFWIGLENNPTFNRQRRFGSTQKGELMTANLEAYKRCLPVDKLSRTIRDAVTVTRALGFRYLWVDALCIIQDADPDKKSQLPLMGSIYQDSAITLAAAVSDHADAGLFAIRDPHAWRPCPVYKESLPNGKSCQIYAQLPRDELCDTPLDTRAWIFQEEILARRTLKFTSKGLLWSCASFCKIMNGDR